MSSTTAGYDDTYDELASPYMCRVREKGWISRETDIL